MRREFQLPEEDEECLAACGRKWESVLVGDAKWLFFPDYMVPDAYNHQRATAAVRIPPSYPDDQIDMVYFSPPLALKSGKAINNLSDCQIGAVAYQQWSRHRTNDNPWRPGLDNVCTHLLQVNDWLEREYR
jgi:E2/UBC family protein E